MSVTGLCVAVLSCAGGGAVMGPLANVTAMVCRLTGRQARGWIVGCIGGGIDR